MTKEWRKGESADTDNRITHSAALNHLDCLLDYLESQDDTLICDKMMLRQLWSSIVKKERSGHGNKTFDIYHCDTSNQKFLNFHERLQTFILFYIDAANYIDVDDAKWNFFVVYEKYKSKCGSVCHAVAGFCTIYEYYAYPDRTRPRVSQMLVLPPFQRQGLGARLLCSVYQYYRSQDNVTDITVEDPNEEFQHLRDYVDACLCASLSSFSKEKLKEGFNTAMASEACQKFKINKKQARRIYEILRLKETNIHNKGDYSLYRLDIKRRLNAPFHKETALIKKLKPLLEEDPQLATALGLKTPEQRFEILEKLYSEIEEEYKNVIERIDDRPLPFSFT